MYRFDIINTLIKKFGYQRYLEIGVEDGEAFSQVYCAVKQGVDPYSANATFRIPLDEFFAMILTTKLSTTSFLLMGYMLKIKPNEILKTPCCTQQKVA